MGDQDRKPEIPEEDAGPELTTPADEISVAEPVLHEAQISDEAVSAASVQEAATEAAEVEREAVAAGVMVGGPVEKAVAEAEADARAAVQDEGSRKDIAQPEAAPEETGPEETPTQDPAPGEQSPATGPFRPRGNRKSSGRGLPPLMLIIIGAAIGATLLVLVIAGLLPGNPAGSGSNAAAAGAASPEGTSLENAGAGGSSPEGVLQQSAQPADLAAADCLRDFVDANQPVTVVSCDAPHNAQLVATFAYAEGDAFPGREALAARNEELCAGVEFSDAVDRFQPLSLTQARPTEDSWDDGDRRVDCIVFTEAGNVMTASLIG